MSLIHNIGNLGVTRLPQQDVAAALAQFTVKFISKAGTYTAVIQSPDGDIIQEYKSVDAKGDPVGVSPSFSASKPARLYFQCVSSRALENTLNGMVSIKAADMRFYVNGQRLAFESDGVCSGLLRADGTTDTSSDFKGMFKRFDANAQAAQLYPGLLILKDVVKAFGFASGTIRMEADVTFATQSDSIRADFPITVRKAAGDSARVAIESLTPNCFAIREKGDTCALIARVYLQGILADPKTLTGAAYEWFRMQVGASGRPEWTSVGSGTCQQGRHVCEVSDDMIDSTGLFMVKVSGLPCGDLVDTQTVTDLSDPYVMDVQIAPEDLTIEDGGNQTVTFTPTLTTRSGAAVAGAKHYFTILDAAGNILNDDSLHPEYAAGKPNGTAFAVDITQCVQAGGDLGVVIEATIPKFENIIDTGGGAGKWEFKPVNLAAVQFDAKYATAL